MNIYVIVFCIVATVFAIASLCYVAVNVLVQTLNRRKHERAIAASEEKVPSAATSVLLLLGSAIGTFGGILAARVVTSPREPKKKNAPQGEQRGKKK